jgi:hypothetical protein
MRWSRKPQRCEHARAAHLSTIESTMPTARFSGRVLPAALNVSIENRPVFHWKADELGLDMTFRVEIQNGLIRIGCDVNKFEDSYLVPLFMRAYDIARASVDVAAFATGSGLTVILEEFIDPGGMTVPLAAQQPALAALATAVKLGTRDFDKVLQFVLAEPRLFMALRDLIEAVTLPHRAVTNCARAIRTLGPLFRASANSPDHAWLALRENLQISKTYLQRIMHQPQSPANGDQLQISGARAAEIVHGAWIVMNRFFEYLKRDGQRLPLSEFPLLI